MKLHVINYGLVIALDKPKTKGTVCIEGYGNVLLNFQDGPTSAVTGKAATLEVGIKISFVPVVEKGINIAKQLHTFDDDGELEAGTNDDWQVDYWAEAGSYESRFADKHLGIVARNDVSKYGSLPLYDDYGDESDS